MKNLIILALVVILGAGAFLSRPTPPKDAFVDFLVAKAKEGDKDLFHGAWDEYRAKSFADSCDYKDRLFWVSVQKRGRTVYVGAFNHWFNKAELKDELKQDFNAVQQKATDEVNQAGSVKDKVDKVIGQ